MSIEHLHDALSASAVTSRPIFVIGSPRSGTTALGNGLGRHSALWASKECYVLHWLLANDRALRMWATHSDRPTPSFLSWAEVEQPEFLGFLGLGINAMFTSRAGGLRWIDPTPLNTPVAEQLADAFPDAQFVHTLRDGRRVVHSMSNFSDAFGDRIAQTRPYLPEWIDDFRVACETWSTWVRSAMELQDARPDRCITVRNEAVADDPSTTVRTILEFLGEKMEDGPVRFLSRTRINTSFPGQIADIDPSEKWSDAHRRIFADIAGPTMVRYGLCDASDLA